MTVFESGNMRLQVLSTRLIGKVNDCYICKDLASSGGTLYTVIVIKEHELVRRVLELFRLSDRQGRNTLIEGFSSGENHVLVFPYHKERPLKDFYEGDAYTLAQCENICINTILTCMSSDLPYPVLNLLLRQGQLQFSADQSVYLGFMMDLTEFDPDIKERDCVRECARILLKILEPKSGQKATSYYLLEKKTANDSYDRFTDLYRDITIAAVTTKKVTIFTVIRLWFKRNGDTIMGIFLWICLILGIFALSIVVSKLFLGGTSWLRLLFNTFTRIGTESLLQ